MEKERKDEIRNFVMLGLEVVLAMWFVAATAISAFWLMGLI